VRRDRCRECGAELTRGPDARCPLCGTDPLAMNSGRLTSLSEVQREKNAAWSHQGAAPPDVDDVDSYQADVQRLREQLRRLRSDAEAV
jgi:hypothetical protein